VADGKQQNVEDTSRNLLLNGDDSFSGTFGVGNEKMKLFLSWL